MQMYQDAHPPCLQQPTLINTLLDLKVRNTIGGTSSLQYISNEGGTAGYKRTALTFPVAWVGLWPEAERGS